MVLFHLNYSLVHIFNNNILNISDTFWFYEGWFSALLFIFIWGLSFYLSEKKYWNNIVQKYLKISALLALIAVCISFSTYFFFPEQYIRFWIIHFFALAFLLLIFFRKLKYYNILIWILIIIYGFYYIPVVDSQYFYFLGFIYPWFSSGDFYPLFPYFWVMLLWYSCGLFLEKINKLKLLKIQNKKSIFQKYLIYIWKKSLLIYIIHQPIIIGIIWLYEYTKGSL